MALRLFASFFVVGLIVTAVILAATTYLPEVSIFIAAGAALVLASIIGFIIAQNTAKKFTEPVEYLWRAILHVTPGHQDVQAPDLEQVKLAKELVTSLTLQIYQLASGKTQEHHKKQAADDANARPSIITNMPMPMFVVDKSQRITQTNNQGAALLGIQKEELIGQSIYDVLDLSFQSEDTLDAWLEDARANKVTDTKGWSRVRLVLGNNSVKQLDLTAFYTKNSPDNTELIICALDKSKTYQATDGDIEFISLAVHELRTPLTMLRGYIEVFEEELDGKLEPELAGYMTKMHASAQQLSTFVTNILNVARVEGNQLYLHLHEEQWPQTLQRAVSDMATRVKARGFEVELSVQPDLPTVAVDKVSVYEVVSNLMDNAIKYSTDRKKIIVRSYLRDDGMVETTVQDFGIGIPNSIIGNLFEKFYRNHRSRTQVGGTGLGLYLCKAIINAHGGQIWVKSKENEGSVFGFTVQQYANLADELKTADNQDIRRTAYGWIKNHSFYKM